ncbi:MAG: ABC transporter permease [Gemmatimonadota bacterium]
MLPEIRRGVRKLFRLDIHQPAVAREEMDDELSFYLESRIDQLVREGMTPAVARAEAIRRLGGTVEETGRQLRHSATRRTQHMRARDWLSDLRQDLGYAARGLAHRPGFTLVAVVTLAIGIGANTAIFSAVNALLLRPLPFTSPDQLMAISLVSPAEADRPQSDDMPWSWPKFLVFRDGQAAFQDLALYSDDDFNVTDGDPERLTGESVSGQFFHTLGLRPQRGRDFAPDIDAHANAAREVILSDALWKRRYNADPALVGRSIDIAGDPHEVIGIAPAGFRGLSGRSDLWIPITTTSEEDLSQAWSLTYSLIGRRKPGATAAQGIVAAQSLGPRIFEAHSAPGGERKPWGATARPLDATRTAPILRQSVLIMFGAVGFVLLIACVNLANLLLGRAAARRREIAIRLAIGASRGRLIRLLLTESLLLALLGGAASVLVAWWGTHLLSSMDPDSALRVQRLGGLGVAGFSSIRFDAIALGFTFLITLLTGMVFGLVPALQATRPQLTETLRGGGGPAPRHGRVKGLTSRRVLIVTEVALAVVLLAGSGLMIRSLAKLLDVDPGFTSENILTLRLTLPPGEMSRDSLPGFYSDLVERISGIPGVTSVALADCPPLNAGCNGTVITFPDRGGNIQPNQAPGIGIHTTSPNWFDALKVPLIRGRLYSEADRLGQPKVLVISESAAKKFWPNDDPIGKRAAVYQGGFEEGATVIGIVGDVRFDTIDSIPVPDAYASYNQAPRSRLMLFISTKGSPAQVAGPVRQAIRELVPAYPVYDIQTMSARVAASSARARFSAILLGFFAAIALALAVVGIYGVMAFAVVQRTREIGIRIALGAAQGQVLRMVIGEGVTLAAIGAIIGIVAALALTRVLASLLFNVVPSDPTTYVALTLLLGGTALAAVYVPARRAARVDPVEALKGE